MVLKSLEKAMKFAFVETRTDEKGEPSGIIERKQVCRMIIMFE